MSYTYMKNLQQRGTPKGSTSSSKGNPQHGKGKELKCQECSASYPRDAKFCMECGQQLRMSMSVEGRQRSRSPSLTQRSQLSEAESTTWSTGTAYVKKHGPLPASYHSQPKSSAFEVDVLQFTGGKAGPKSAPRVKDISSHPDFQAYVNRGDAPGGRRTSLMEGTQTEDCRANNGAPFAPLQPQKPHSLRDPGPGFGFRQEPGQTVGSRSPRSPVAVNKSRNACSHFSTSSHGSSCPHCTAQWPPVKVGGNRPVHHFQPNFTHGSQEGSSVRSHTPPDPYPERPTDVYYPSAIAQPASGVAVGNGGVKFANGELRRQSLGNVEDIEDYIRNSILGWYKTLEEAFDSMDIDKDGLIDSNEFADALKTSFGMDFLTRLETTALMSRFDTDGDGYIDGEEFLRFIRKDSVPEGPVDQSIIDQTIAKFKNHLEVQFASMRDAFRQLDDDRNGSISKQEFATVLKNFDIKVTDSELDALVQRYDTNNDGRVSHTEFLKVMAC